MQMKKAKLLESCLDTTSLGINGNEWSADRMQNIDCCA